MLSSGGGGGAPGAAVLDYVTSAQLVTVTTSFTFTSLSFGSETARDLVVVVVGGTGNALTDRYATGVTIGGVTAAQAGSNTTNGNGRFCSIWYAAPSGSSGNVVVTMSGNTAHCAVAVYRLENLLSTVPRDTGDDSAAPASIPLTTLTGGVAIAGVMGENSYVIGGIDVSDALEQIGAVHRFQTGHIEPTGTSETVTGNSGEINFEAVAAAWR